MDILQDKLEALKKILTGYGRILIALSGGVDSVFLLTFAYTLWEDDRASAVTASGPHFADDETEYAKRLCANLGISHRIVPADHILPVIKHNPEDRCYICKKEIFTALKKYADDEGRVLTDGTNLDDMDDYRPGYRALQELGITNPLKDAGLTKQEIRRALSELADSDPSVKAALMTDIWNKPAFACLASRIPYREMITEEKLSAVYRAEVFLRELGFDQVRVRHHGDVARIEVLPEDRCRFYDSDFMDKVNDGIRNCGFRFAALDLGGYKMGNLNKMGNLDKKEI